MSKRRLKLKVLDVVYFPVVEMVGYVHCIYEDRTRIVLGSPEEIDGTLKEHSLCIDLFNKSFTSSKIGEFITKIGKL